MGWRPPQPVGRRFRRPPWLRMASRTPHRLAPFRGFPRQRREALRCLARFARSRDGAEPHFFRHRAQMLIRGLILLVVVTAVLFVAMRAFTRAGSPDPCDSATQTCVTTNPARRGGGPGDA